MKRKEYKKKKALKRALSWLALIELTELLKEESDNVHFKETVTEEDGIQFDYLLQDGPGTSRNALLLVQTMAFPDSVIDSAQELAKQFDEEQVWETV